MALNPNTAPPSDLLRAYMLTFGAEHAQIVMADLRATLAAIERDRTDKTGRMDPLKLAVADGARTILKRIETLQAMESTREWQEIERLRQFAAARIKMEQSHG